MMTHFQNCRLPSGRPLFTLGSTLALSLTALVSLSNAATIKPPTRVIVQDNPKAVLDEAWQIVNQVYVDPKFNNVNWLQVRQQLLSQNYTSRESAYAALKAALKKLNDPYTRFFDPNEFKVLSSQDINGELTGVGLQLELDSTAKVLQVNKVLRGSPAQQAGIKAGDQILQIDGQSTAGMSVETAASLIRGKENTIVNLVIRRPQRSAITIALTRQRIEVPVVDSALRQSGSERIGYIRLSDFSGHSAEQMRGAIAELLEQKVDRFVLDLRGNPGGRLDQELAIARMWLNQGALVHIVVRDGESLTVRANGTALTDLPLTVLVDGGSASASEVLAGALKDNRRATVVGSQTYGKALVQVVNPLSDGSGLNVTIARYLTPSGLDINQRGITPDVVVNLTPQQRQDLLKNPDKIGTSADPQYQRALATTVIEQNGQG